MTNKLSDLTKYVVVRGISAIVTISIFGLFARQLFAHELENALSFSLLFGFFCTLTRTLPSFAAKVEAHQSSEERQSSVLVGYKSAFWAQLPLIPLFLLLAYEITASPAITFVAAAILLVSSFDFDLSRAADAQVMMFPRLFLLGSVVALAYFGMHLGPDQDTAFTATLIQWVPVSIYSGYRLSLVGLRRIRQATISFSHALTSIMFVSFDGFILNLPMMPFIPISEDMRIEIAILVRNFSASLFMLPFLIFLSNKVRLPSNDRKIRFQKLIFFAGIFGSSILAFYIYILYFGLITGKSLAPSNLLTVLPLAFGFAAYYAHARYFKVENKAGAKIVASMVLIGICATATFYFASLDASQVLYIQASSFLVMTAVFVVFDQNQRK